MTAGMPFGLARTVVLIISINTDLTMSLGVIVMFLHIVNSGIFGDFIAIYTIVKAMIVLIVYPIKAMKGLMCSSTLK